MRGEEATYKRGRVGMDTFIKRLLGFAMLNLACCRLRLHLAQIDALLLLHECGDGYIH